MFNEDKNKIQKGEVENQITLALTKTPKKINELFEKIFWIKDQGTFLHWKETSGFKHNVLGKYIKNLNDLTDSFIESYVGVFSNETLYISESLYKVDNDITNEAYINETEKIFLSFYKLIDGVNGLTNILDDVLSLILKTKYLLTKS